MLTVREREAIANLWAEKESQDCRNLPRQDRHRNLEPASAEFICALASGCGPKRLIGNWRFERALTIALGAAARETGGRLVSIEIEPVRQQMAVQRLSALGLADRVDFVLADAGNVLDRYDALSSC